MSDRDWFPSYQEKGLKFQTKKQEENEMTISHPDGSDMRNLPPETSGKDIERMRTFNTGATRDDDEEKWDYEGFLSPLVLRRYAEYMHKHRKQSDGKLRASDNWQKGIPIAAYLKSLWRHLIELWTFHRDAEQILNTSWEEKEETLCAIIFNASGYLHESIKERGRI